MNNGYSLLSLNIEFDLHTERVIAHLKEMQPDIICLQEIPKTLTKYFAKELDCDFSYTHAAILRHIHTGELIDIGLMLAWNKKKVVPLEFQEHEYSPGDTRSQIWCTEYPNATKRILKTMRFKNGGEEYVVGTTHFTWTPNGKPSKWQFRDLTNFLNECAKYDALDGIVFCGDFNAPRGGEIFSLIAEKYTDNIPLHITTTIDQKIHKVSSLNLVVDGIFSTPNYVVKDVVVSDGVSDHMSLFAQVSKSVC